jgi:hypothetical protein
MCVEAVLSLPATGAPRAAADGITGGTSFGPAPADEVEDMMLTCVPVPSAICVAVLILGLTLLSGSSAGAVHAQESVGGLLRTDICLNGVWQVADGADDPVMPSNGWRPARTPHMPLAEEGRPSAIWYRRTLHVPADWARPGRRFFVEFEKVGHYAAVFCNGERVGEHFGQFAPFEVELTRALSPGKANELAVYVHDASGAFVRPGAVVDDPMVGPAYRPGARGAQGRNWVGIVGDVTLSWRPAVHVEDAFVVTSVREQVIEARLALSDAPEGMTCRAAVMDGGEVVVRLPEQPAARELSLSARWSDPVLWGPPPYGEPKLYRLRTELVRDGRVVDRMFARFGFREVWVDGRDVMLNGRKLWMVGYYTVWLGARRYINDRRPMAAELRALQAAGLNMLNGHWDDLGRTYLDLCDEMGVLVLGAAYCNSQLPFQPDADEGWADWMTAQTGEWTRARRNHPSIVAWRPICGAPKNLRRVSPDVQISRRLGDAVRANDDTRPVADRGDIFDHNQGSKNAAGDYDDASGIARVLETVGMPVLTIEIWTGFDDVPGFSGFFERFYRASYAGGSTGFVPQHLPFFRSVPFTPSWPSLSGPGNRETDWRVREACVNWCDPGYPPCEEEPYGRLFARLYEEHTGRRPEVYAGRRCPEVLVSGAPVDSPVFFVPLNGEAAAPVGLLPAPDGTAWAVLPMQGSYRVVAGAHERGLEVEPQAGIPEPGYKYVQGMSLEEKEEGQ